MAHKKEFYLTKTGLDKLKAELDDLVHNKRKEIAKQLKEARDYGDLSENSSWDDAKDRQAFIEGRIAEIETIIKNAKTIEKTNGNIINIGSIVHIELEDGTQRFQIVGSTEANPSEGKISNESPIGKALIGKTKGDTVKVDVPAGSMTYTVIKVE